MSAQPRHAFNAPPEMATLPAFTVRITEKETPDDKPAPAVWHPANTPRPSAKKPPANKTPVSGKEADMPVDKRREEYKAARLRGLDHADTGKAAGYKWKTANTVKITGNKLDRELGISVAGKISAFPKRALNRAIKRAGKAILAKAREDRAAQSDGDHIAAALAMLRERRDEIDKAIATLEALHL